MITLRFVRNLEHDTIQIIKCQKERPEEILSTRTNVMLRLVFVFHWETVSGQQYLFSLQAMSYHCSPKFHCLPVFCCWTQLKGMETFVPIRLTTYSLARLRGSKQ